jgi:hypothetical protein
LRAQARSSLIKTRLRPTADRYFCAKAREGACDAQIDPAASAGDEYGFPCEEIARKNLIGGCHMDVHIVTLFIAF